QPSNRRSFADWGQARNIGTAEPGTQPAIVLTVDLSEVAKLFPTSGFSLPGAASSFLESAFFDSACWRESRRVQSGPISAGDASALY
ncbi:unnamed protein product, partial [Ixodes persulcatus]